MHPCQLFQSFLSQNVHLASFSSLCIPAVLPTCSSTGTGHCKSKVYFKRLCGGFFLNHFIQILHPVSSSLDLGPFCPTLVLSFSHSTQSTENAPYHLFHNVFWCLISCAADTFLTSDPDHTYSAITHEVFRTILVKPLNLIVWGQVFLETLQGYSNVQTGWNSLGWAHSIYNWWSSLK